MVDPQNAQVRYPLIGRTILLSEGRSPRLDDPIGREARVDKSCEGILSPENPDCCFMTDAEHNRTKPFGQPLHNSPYKINLVAVEKRTLNNFTKSTYNNSQMWVLTPLRDNQYTNKQTAGGPIKLQVSTHSPLHVLSSFVFNLSPFS